MLQLVFDNISYLGIVALLVVGVVLPIPEELVVLTAAWASYYQQMNPWLALLSCLCGALCGDCLLYALGYHFGHGILREHRYFGRFLRPDRELQVEQLIKRYGFRVLFAARFLVGLRSTAYLAAGILRMPFRPFFVVDVFCASTVIGLVFGLCYVFASRIDSLWVVWDRFRDAEYALTFIIVALVGGVVFWYWRRHRRRVARIRLRQHERAIRRSGIVGATAVPTEPAPSPVAADAATQSETAV